MLHIIIFLHRILISWWLGYFELISNNLTIIKILISGTSECLVDLVEIKLFFFCSCLCLLLSVFWLYFSHDAWVWNTRYGSSHDASASISFSEREELLREKKNQAQVGGKNKPPGSCEHVLAVPMFVCLPALSSPSARSLFMRFLCNYSPPSSGERNCIEKSIWCFI